MWKDLFQKTNYELGIGIANPFSFGMALFAFWNRTLHIYIYVCIYIHRYTYMCIYIYINELGNFLVRPCYHYAEVDELCRKWKQNITCSRITRIHLALVTAKENNNHIKPHNKDPAHTAAQALWDTSGASANLNRGLFDWVCSSNQPLIRRHSRTAQWTAINNPKGGCDKWLPTRDLSTTSAAAAHC